MSHSLRMALRNPSWRMLAVTSAIASGVLALLACASAAYAGGNRTAPVGPGDMLQIAVFGEENVSNALSGRFPVEQDGTIYYPLLGTIDVSGKNAIEIGDILEKRLEGQLPVNLSSVTIAEFAPVYLMGETVSTGAFAYEPDMTVFDLVLRAGGVSRQEASENARLSLMQETKSLELTGFSLDVQKARLTAELNSKEFDPAPFADASLPGADSIVAAEASIFDVHKRAWEARQSTYEAQKKGYDQEIVSVGKGIELHDEEVRLLEDQLDARKTLADKGFAANSTLTELKRQLTAARRDSLEFQTALFRARQNRITADRDFSEAKILLDTQNVEKLREAEVALEQNKIALASAKKRLAQFETTANAAQNALGRNPIYTLIRHKGSDYISSSVDSFAKLERGDIIRVSFAETGSSVIQAGDPVQPTARLTQ